MRMALAVGLLAWGYGSASGPMRPPSASGPPTFAVAGGRLRVEVCADDIVRVAFAKDDAFFCAAVADGGAEAMHGRRPGS